MSFFGRRFRVTLWHLFLILSTTGFATAYVVSGDSGITSQSALDRLNAGAPTQITFNITPSSTPDFGLATPLLSYRQGLLDSITRPAANEAASLPPAAPASPQTAVEALQARSIPPVLPNACVLPNFTTQPADATVCPNGLATLGVVANNTVGYQWQSSADSINWIDILGAGGMFYNATPALTTFYRAIAMSACGNTTSNVATVSVTSTSITSQPVDVAVCPGQNATFSVTATNASGYQWESSTDGVNFSPIAGANATTYTESNTTPGFGFYRVQVTGCTPVTSNVASYTVTAAPLFTTQPVSGASCATAATTLTAIANNTTSYQWQSSPDAVNWSNIAGETASIYNATPSASTYYRALAIGACVTPSNAALITVTAPPVFTSQPSGASLCGAGVVPLSASATGATSYQWQSSSDGINWLNISGAAGSSYNASVNVTTYYQLIATNSCGSAKTNPALVTVSTAPAITTQPATVTACLNSNVTFSVVASNATSYQWQYSNDTVTWFPVGGATSASYTFTYTGAPWSYRVAVIGCSTVYSNPVGITTATIPMITAQPAGSSVCPTGNFTMSVGAIGAVSYQWQSSTGGPFANISGATGPVLSLPAPPVTTQYQAIVIGSCSSVTSTPATITVNPLPTITTQPAGTTICAGAPVSLSGAALNATSYQWQSSPDGISWTAIGGAVAAIYNTSPNITTYYRLNAINSCGTASSNAALVTVTQPPTITTQPQSVSACPNANVTFSVAATNATSYSWYVSTDGISFSPMIGQTGPTLSLTNTGGSPWFKAAASNSCFTAYSNAVSLTTSAVPPAFITQPQPASSCSGQNVTMTASASNVVSYQWEQSADGITFTSIPGANTATLSVAPTATTTYRAIAINTCGSAKSNAATVTIVSNPITITSQPASVTACAGSKVTFSVTATGAATYQWQSSAGGAPFTDIGGAVGPSLTVTAPNMTTVYQVRLFGLCSSVTSSPATLTAGLPITISQQPVSTTVCAGQPASFKVAASGSGTLAYQWMLNGKDIPGATSASFAIGAATAADAGTYSVRITSICSTVSNGALLTVADPPAITSKLADFIGCENDTPTFSVNASGLGLTYQWFVNSSPIGGANAASFTPPRPMQNGTVSVTVTNACGVAQASAAIKIEKPAVTFTVVMPTANATVPPGKVGLLGTGTCAGPPTGNVTLSFGGVSLGTRTFLAGMALFDFNGSSAGDFTVQYGGDSSYPAVTTTPVVAGAAIPLFDDRVLLLLAAAMAIAGLVAMKRT